MNRSGKSVSGKGVDKASKSSSRSGGRSAAAAAAATAVPGSQGEPKVSVWEGGGKVASKLGLWIEAEVSQLWE
jgi:hypothetical protein